jgi:hypothetical protein
LVRLRVKRFLNNLESPRCPKKKKKRKKKHNNNKTKEERSKQLKLNLMAKIK